MHDPREYLKAKLRVKYGLAPNEPTNAQIDLFLELLKKKVDQGLPIEEAGEEIARLCFPSFQSCKYASYADTLHDLLRAIRTKGK